MQEQKRANVTEQNFDLAGDQLPGIPYRRELVEPNFPSGAFKQPVDSRICINTSDFERLNTELRARVPVDKLSESALAGILERRRAGAIRSLEELAGTTGVGRKTAKRLQQYLHFSMPELAAPLRLIFANHGRGVQDCELYAGIAARLVRAEIATVEADRPLVVWMERALLPGWPITMQQFRTWCEELSKSSRGIVRGEDFDLGIRRADLTEQQKIALEIVREVFAGVLKKYNKVEAKDPLIEVSSFGEKIADIIRDRASVRFVQERPSFSAFINLMRCNGAMYSAMNRLRDGRIEAGLQCAFDAWKFREEEHRLRAKEAALQLKAAAGEFRESLHIVLRGTLHRGALSNQFARDGIVHTCTLPTEGEAAPYLFGLRQYLHSGTPLESVAQDRLTRGGAEELLASAVLSQMMGYDTDAEAGFATLANKVSRLSDDDLWEWLESYPKLEKEHDGHLEWFNSKVTGRALD